MSKIVISNLPPSSSDLLHNRAPGTAAPSPISAYTFSESGHSEADYRFSCSGKTENKNIYLSITCRLLVDYLSITCRLLVVYLSFTCRFHVY